MALILYALLAQGWTTLPKRFMKFVIFTWLVVLLSNIILFYETWKDDHQVVKYHKKSVLPKPETTSIPEPGETSVPLEKKCKEQRRRLESIK